ncbi:MAG TPA: ATP-binding cassette domain-containing protein, partial [Thermomicrobiales bacterium]|nr:ATP-binding cassette domain-containing protein [Thermomicrobiales bacterium]
MITATGLTKRYGTTAAVDGLTFDVTPGIVTGFLGPNGAGKSTTMRMILGLDSATAGTVTVNGHAYRDTRAPMQEIGALIDPSAVHNGRSAYHHLLWQAQAGGLPRNRVDDVLEMVGLTEVAGKRVGGFSLGMHQRLGIASALLGDPPVLLFDEPVNGLDPEGIQWVRTLMRQFAAEGRTVFISSHMMSEMEQTADHVLVIGRGRLVADMSMAEFMQRSAHSHVKIVSLRAHDLIPHLEAKGALVANGTPNELTV